VFDAGRLPRGDRRADCRAARRSPAAKASPPCQRQRGVTLLVVPTDKDVEQVVADARFFHARSRARPRPTSSRRCCRSVAAGRSLPGHDPALPGGGRPEPRASRRRAGTTRLIVASAPALLPRVSPPERLLRAARDPARAPRSSPRRWPTCWSTPASPGGSGRRARVVRHPRRHRRSLSAADAEPVRLEFVGDMVESLRRFDPATQRSTGPTDQVAIVPVRELFDDEDQEDLSDTVSVLQFLAQLHGLQVIVSEYEQVEEAARRARDSFERSHADAAARGGRPQVAPTAASWIGRP
jgi:hypothetical protein